MRVLPFPGDADPTHLLPPVFAHSAPHYEALDEGVLALQRCTGCDRLRYPVAPSCPHCGDDSHRWTEIEPVGLVHSWVRYHKSYLPEFSSLMPYSVVIAQLQGGVRVVGRWLDTTNEPVIGMPVDLVAERFPSGRCVIAVVPAERDRRETRWLQPGHTTMSPGR